LLCKEIIKYIIKTWKSFGKDDYNYENVIYTHDVQKWKAYRNFNDNWEDKFFDIYESFSNFNLGPEHNK
jgi:hypothetical protein